MPLQSVSLQEPPVGAARVEQVGGDIVCAVYQQVRPVRATREPVHYAVLAAGVPVHLQARL